MSSIKSILIFLLEMCIISLQQPTFFRNTYKGLTGIVPKIIKLPEEIRVAYYHEQTVAIVDLGVNNELHNCNFIEVYEPEEIAEVLRNLSTVTRPQKVSFHEMVKLLHQCELLDELLSENIPVISPDMVNKGNYAVINSLTLLSGILPGTKWCGTGDIADNYHDLGQKDKIDRCCRSHDLCPVKIRAQRSRYNLTNYSLYTKSHCLCDEALYHCLKAAKDKTANIMGNIYFNIVKVSCIDDVLSRQQIGSKRQFVSAKMSY